MALRGLEIDEVWYDEVSLTDFGDGRFESRLVMQCTNGRCWMQAATIYYPADDLGNPVEVEQKWKNKPEQPTNHPSTAKA